MNAKSGLYTAPHNGFAIPVPLGWTLTHGTESLELLGPGGEVAIVVSYYMKTGSSAETDARVHLKRFLDGQDVKGKARTVIATSKRASADFLDTSEKRWRIMFCSGPSGLLLATSTCSSAAAKGNFVQAAEVLNGIVLGA